jgi:NADP-dependent 3-hydroxy acid dehydrogenase YdfG
MIFDVHTTELSRRQQLDATGKKLQSTRCLHVLVAGAEGQIALRIVRELANAGEKVVAGAQDTKIYSDI